MIGFDSKLQQQFTSFHKKETVTISSCQIKPAKQADQLEVIVKSFSGITRSPSKFTVPDDVGSAIQTSITMKKLDDMPLFQRINITAKAVRVYDPEHVPNGKTKQVVFLADNTGTGKLVLWEEDIGKIEKGLSYTLTGLVFRIYNHNKYLSMPKDVTIEEVPEIRDVNEGDDQEDSERCNLLKFPSCKAINPASFARSLSSSVLGRCTKCNMLQRVDQCQQHLPAQIRRMAQPLHSKPLGT